MKRWDIDHSTSRESRGIRHENLRDSPRNRSTRSDLWEYLRSTSLLPDVVCLASCCWAGLHLAVFSLSQSNFPRWFPNEERTFPVDGLGMGVFMSCFLGKAFMLGLPGQKWRCFVSRATTGQRFPYGQLNSTVYLFFGPPSSEDSQQTPFFGWKSKYPLVNSHSYMENHHAING